MNTKIITIANQKGGVGKSKLSYNIAIELTAPDKKAILFDTDPQQSCLTASKYRDKKNKTIKVETALTNIHQRVDEVKDEFDFIVIDTPPHDNKTMALAVMCADLVIIPVQDSPMDILSTSKTVDLVNEAQKNNPDLKAYLLLSRIQPNTILSRELTDSLNSLYNIPILKSITTNRVDYKQAIIYGQSVTEFKPKSKASEEIQSIITEIKSILL